MIRGRELLTLLGGATAWPLASATGISFSPRAPLVTHLLYSPRDVPEQAEQADGYWGTFQRHRLQRLRNQLSKENRPAPVKYSANVPPIIARFLQKCAY